MLCSVPFPHSQPSSHHLHGPLPCRIMGLGKDKAWMDILPEVIKNYGQAVQYGHRQIFQALPRLLTLWTGFGEEMAREQVGKVRGGPSRQFAV